MASARSILATRQRAGSGAGQEFAPGACRPAFLGKETATKSTPNSAAVRISWRSLAGQGARGRQAAALAVDALVVGQHAADANRGDDLLTVHGDDVEDDAAVVEEQDDAGLDVVDQFRVIEADPLGVAELAADVEDEGGAGGEPTCRVRTCRRESSAPADRP